LLRRFAAIPPAAAEGREERRGIGETVRLGLHQSKLGLLVRLLGVEHRKIRYLTDLLLVDDDP
jgi:hypothetical protein